MEFKRILVVDDEPLMRDFLVEALQRKKYYVDVAEDGWKAIEKIKNDYFHLVITDNRHPGPCGVEIIKFTKKHSAETEVIMITAFGEVENAVEAMKMGAFCYLFKPFQADEIVLRVECALEHQKPRSKRILVVDDEPLMREFLLNVLKGKYVVDSVCDGAQAIEKIKADYFDLVITDIRMPEVNGMEVLQAVKKHSTETEVIMITSFGEVENAVTAMKIGAFHYLQKPFQADEVVLLVERALERQKSREENCTLRNVNIKLQNQLKEKSTIKYIVGSSEVMQKVYETIEAISTSKATVLIQGESGTGKELVARAIHYNSTRQNKPFIKIHCAALPEGLMESELFGHEKGAFSGAIKSTKGLIELADTGTLLLDEIGDMSFPLHKKIESFLQNKKFEKMGDPTPISVDVRVIATTNRNLEEEVKKGNFREDLYYRLNVVPLFLPPLRERKEDIPLLVDHFIKKYREENDKVVRGIYDDALELLKVQEWKGNVRELENYIERAVVLCREDVLSAKYFQFGREVESAVSAPGVEGITPGMTLREVEKRLILSTLEVENNNRIKAAEKLSISVRTLRQKLNEYSREDT